MANNMSDLIVNGNRLLKLYSYFSLAVALIIMALHVITPESSVIGQQALNISMVATILYVVVAASFVAIAAMGPDVQMATSYFFLETALLSTLMFASGGLNTGFSSLILVCVVVSNLITPGVLGYAVAAWTTLAIMVIQHFWPDRYESTELLNSGIYGLICFLLAGLTQALSYKLNSALELATAQNTYLKRLEEISWQAMAELPTGIIACDADQRVIFFNQRAQQWLNLEEGSALPEQLTTLNKNDRPVFEFNGQPLKARRAELPKSEPGDYLIYLEDQTRVATAAQQLKLASLGRLTASIAHEIRNPLSALQQASQLLAETDYLKDEEQYLCRVIEQHCLRINRTVEDVLELSRKRQAVITLQRLKPWLEHFREQFTGVYRDENYELQIRCADEAMAGFDPDHLQQILHNLCSNGLRYALQQNPNNACLILAVKQDSADRIKLEVIDNGPGISEENASHLFEPFYTTEHNGTGLGLYLSRELCEANQATLKYQRLPDGSCFRLTLKTEINA